MSRANLYVQDVTGNWVPARGGPTGELQVSGGGSGVSAPTSQPEILDPWRYVAGSGGITNTTDVTLKAAPAAGYSNYLQSLQVCNTDGTGTEVVIKDGSTTVIWRSFFGATMNSTLPITFNPPLYSSSAAALTAACVTDSSTTYINAQGYVDKTIAQINAQNTVAEEIFAQDGTPVLDGAGAQIYMA